MSLPSNPLSRPSAAAQRIVSQRAFGRALRRSSRLVQRALESALARTNLSFAQWSTLWVVKEAGEITLGDLAREIEMTSGAMTRLIDGLEARALVRRDRSSSDRRLVKVVATQIADAALDAAGPVITAVWSQLLEEFPLAEITQMAGSLSSLVAVLERHPANNPAFSVESMS